MLLEWGRYDSIMIFLLKKIINKVRKIHSIEWDKDTLDSVIQK